MKTNGALETRQQVRWGRVLPATCPEQLRDGLNGRSIVARHRDPR
ncbi:MAG TPA: hypothetical protein VNM72_05675 [Blastocatellia bacterium]|nr:hypothetical protein [Blastocatellia bacterium]